MTATDELRRLLDERGVKYDAHGERYGTWYDTPLGGHVYVPENNAGWLHVRSDAMTPEQAIAATLGDDGVGRTNDGVDKRGTCHMERANWDDGICTWAAFVVRAGRYSSTRRAEVGTTALIVGGRWSSEVQANGNQARLCRDLDE